MTEYSKLVVTSQHPQAGVSDPKLAEEKENEERTNTQATPSNARPAAAGGVSNPQNFVFTSYNMISPEPLDL
ncbi:hypothetical protein D4S03_03480 [bacterium]|nr:MAG: hypothetical protein D4S03_03480 [bacterium]